ncbi:hypothetical protein DV515_00018723, partial [Chloebia gouldiae]
MRSSPAPKHPAAQAPPGPHCTAQLKAQEPPQPSPSFTRSAQDLLSPALSQQKQLPALSSYSSSLLRPPARQELLLKQQEEEKRLPTHLVPEEEEVREVDERAETWPAFYSSPGLPQAQRHLCGSHNFLTSSCQVCTISVNGWASPAATVAVGDAGDVKAPKDDGHSIRAEDAANRSRGGGSSQYQTPTDSAPHSFSAGTWRGPRHPHFTKTILNPGHLFEDTSRQPS